MKILVQLSNMFKNTTIKVDYDNNKLFVNDKISELDAKTFAARLISLTYLWPEKLINNDINDGESYSIKIKNNGVLTEKIGVNKFPDNYILFKALINEVTNVRAKNT